MLRAARPARAGPAGIVRALGEQIRGPAWPTKRPDGTVSVVARFAVGDSGAIDVIRQTIDGWLSVTAKQGLDVRDDLVTAPYTESPDSTTSRWCSTGPPPRGGGRTGLLNSHVS